MKYGIYYAYWEKEWGGDFIPYIAKVKKLGFDILEVACGDFHNQTMEYFEQMKQVANSQGIMLTGGYGPRPEHNISCSDPAVVENAFAFYHNIFPKMKAAGIRSLCGALYSYWPVDYSQQPDKQEDYKRSVKNMRALADLAADYGIQLYMEALNRFEGYLINTAEEALGYVQAVDKQNVKILLDTFHMNIEEDSIAGAIRTAGKYLAELHVGEANRRPPHNQGRINWAEISDMLNEIGFDGNVVMEPFEMMGGQVGQDIKIWRDMSVGQNHFDLDDRAAKSLKLLRGLFVKKEVQS